MRDCRRFHHRGTVLVAALVCMAIVGALVGSMLLAALRASRQLHAERDLRQCELLLEAGLSRAAQRLATETDYRNETWTLAADQITGASDGQVSIDLLPASDTNPRSLRVTAEYPTGGETSICRSRVIVLSPKTSPSQE